MVSPSWDVRFVFCDEQRILTSVGSLSYVIHHTASLAFGVLSEIPLSRVSSKKKSKYWQHFPANVAGRKTTREKWLFYQRKPQPLEYYICITAPLLSNPTGVYVSSHQQEGGYHPGTYGYKS
jgi:hypothetical protein